MGTPFKMKGSSLYNSELNQDKKQKNKPGKEKDPVNSVTTSKNRFTTNLFKIYGGSSK
jgi:flagellar basal body-associated protein FliL